MNPSGPRSHPPPQDPAPPSPHRRERRAFRTGLAASVVVHLLAIALYPILTGIPGPEVPDERAPQERPPLEGTEVVAIRELPEVPEEVVAPEPVPDPPVDAQPEEPPDPDEPEEEPGEAVDEVEAPEPGLSVAERLQPRMIDPRLWAPVDRHAELTEAERAELLLRGMIRTWNDSAAVAAALRDDARDWTYTDSEGQRWGLSPGRLHLGDFSIPLPFAFAAPPGQWEERLNQQWILDDLAHGRETAIIRDTWAERARQIRERMEGERASGAEADGGG